MSASLPTPSIQITSAPVKEGQQAVFELTLVSPHDDGSRITLRLGSATDTATSDRDYSSRMEYSLDGVNWMSTGALDRFNMGPGVTRAWVRTATLTDTLDEGSESLTLTASVYSADNLETAVATASNSTVIQDPVIIQPPSVSISSTTVTEGTDSHAVFTVRLQPANPDGGQVSLALASGTATVGTDFSSRLEVFDGSTWRAYDPAQGLRFAPGVTALQVRTAIVDDALVESSEAFTLKATPGTGVGGAAAVGTATLLDNDSARVTVNDVTVTEGPNAFAVFKVGLDKPVLADSTIKLSLSNGTALAGKDYATGLEVEVGGRWVPYDTAKGIVLAAGVTSVAVRARVLDDTLVEADETFKLTATPVSGAGLDKQVAVGTATIVDNDQVRVASISDSSVSEGNSLLFDIKLSQTTAGPSVLDLKLANGTAIGGPGLPADYINTSMVVRYAVGTRTVVTQVGPDGKITLPANVSAVKVAVTTLDDTTIERNETLKLTASMGGKSLTGTGTILDNDFPTVSIDRSVTVTEGTDTHATFTVRLSQPSFSDAVVKLSLSEGPSSPGGGNATAGKDFGTLEVLNGSTWVRYDPAAGMRFAAGTTSLQVRAAVINDTFKENTEGFSLNVQATSGATGKATATATILDNDRITVVNESYTVPNSTTITGNVLANDRDSEGSPLKVMGFSTNSNMGGPLPGGYFAPGSSLVIAGKGTVSMDANGNFSFTPVPGYSSPLPFSDIKLYYIVNDNTELNGGFGLSELGTASIVVRPPLPEINVSSSSVAESAGTGGWTVSFAKAMPFDGQLQLDIKGGTASAGADYSTLQWSRDGQTWTDMPADGKVNVTSGQTAMQVRVKVIDDSTIEPNETVVLGARLTSDGQPGVTRGAEGTLTILDNDQVVVRSISDASAVEGRALGFDVAFSQATVAPTQLRLVLTDGTASSVGTEADYIANGRMYVLYQRDGQSHWLQASGGVVTVPAGVSGVKVHIDAIDDTRVENSETFRLSAEMGGATVTGTGTIIDNDSGFRVGDATVVEPATDFTPAVLRFVVERTGDTSGAANINYQTRDGSATGSVISNLGPDGTRADYQSASGTLYFSAGETRKEILVTAYADNRTEPTENMFVELSGASSGAQIVDGTGEGKIIDYTPPAEFYVAGNQVTEGDDGVTPGYIMVCRRGNFDVECSVSYSLIGNHYLDATKGVDYTMPQETGTLHFAAGERVKQVRVDVIGDRLIEGNEQVRIQLSNPVGGVIAEHFSVGGLLIVDDDAAPPPPPPEVGPPTLSIADSSVIEGNDGQRMMNFTVTRSGDLSGGSAAVFRASNGTADSADYASGQFGVVQFFAGESSKTISIPVYGDTRVEADETFTVSFDSVYGATVARGTATGTIINDDSAPPPSAPTLSIADSSVIEGNDGQRMMNFTVTRSGDLSGGSVAVFRASNGSADSSDYSSGHFGVVQFFAGESSKIISIPVYGDTQVEANETFTVSLENAQGATVSRGTATGTIINDDVAPTPVAPTLSIADSSVVEGNDGQRMMNFTVTRSGDLSGGSAAVFRASNGSADSSDYSSGHFGVVQFFAGESSKTISIPVYGDTRVEANETFTVSLENAQGATVSRGTATGTIINDDVAPPPVVPTVSVNDITIYELRLDGNGRSYPDGTPNWGSFTVSLNQATTVPVTVTLRTQDGTAVTTGNYDRSTMDYSAIGSVTVTFQPGETSKQVSVAVYADDDGENEEYFNLLVTGVTNATVADGTGRCTIPENNSPLVLDLNGDGVKSVAMGVGAFYDLMGVGEARRSGWTDGQDGFLVRDLNGDGQINDGREMLGEGTVLASGSRARDGFEALRELDTNSDGRVDANDAAFSTLKVWQDRDGDGVTDEGELLTLQQAGVASLGTGYQVSDKVENDNLHLLQGSYESTDGQTREMTDVFFRVGSQVATEIVPVGPINDDAASTGQLWTVAGGTQDVLIRGFDTHRDTLDLRDLFPGAEEVNLDALLGVRREGNDTVLVVEGEQHAGRDVILAGVDLGSDASAVLQQMLQAERLLV